MKMKKKSIKISKEILVIILIILVVCVGFYFYRSNEIKRQKEEYCINMQLTCLRECGASIAEQCNKICDNEYYLCTKLSNIEIPGVIVGDIEITRINPVVK